MKNIARVAASTAVMAAGLGLAGLGAAAVAQAQPAPFPDYHWCPGQWWDPGWGGNWDGGRCHDDHWFDGEARDQGHWHNGPYDDHWQGDQHWQGGNPQWQGGNPGDQDHWH
ncbi:MAG: hypothetical protein ACLPLP_21900 [Mycobacterium sp.]